MKRIIILLMCLFIVALPLEAGRRSSGKAKTTHTTTTRKTVHVKAYTKKNGTHVNAYYRSAPHSKKHK